MQCNRENLTCRPLSLWLFAIILWNGVVAIAASGQATPTPLFFVENHGQYDSRVLYRTQANGVTLWFTDQGVVYQFARVKNHTTLNEDATTEMAISGKPDSRNFAVEYNTVNLKLVGTTSPLELMASGVGGSKANFFVGNDPELWQTNIPVRTELRFEGVYPGVDLKYYGNSGSLEYDFEVAPGNDASAIHLQYDGVESVSTNNEGDLVIVTEWGTMVEKRPRVLQEISGKVRELVGQYVVYGEREYGFKFSGDVDRSHPVIIDPVITFSTYLGGTSYEEGWGMVVDNDGYIYVTGLTASTDFPTVPAQSAIFPVDVFVSKLSPNGSNLIYSTFVGGNNYDGACNIAVDGSGNVYVTGETKSSNFPTVNAYQALYGGNSDCFVFRLQSDGSGLDYSTYLGGTNFELGRAISANKAGNAYVIGHTCSSDFPTQNAMQSSYGGDGPSMLHCGDAFVTKFPPLGGVPVFCTFVGGSSYDEGWGIDIDALDNVYAVGLTASTNFPTINSIYPPAVLVDAFLVKIRADGQALNYGTYLGGNNYDGATSVAIDKFNNAYVAGETKSSNLPQSNALYSSFSGASDAFVTKVNSSGSAVDYSFYVGGTGSELAWDVDVDDFGGAIIAGHTFSPDLLTTMPLQPVLNGFRDIFVSRLAPSGTLLTFSTYFGGSSEDIARSVNVYNGRSIIFSGTTVSADYPVQNAYQPSYAGGTFFPRGDVVVSSLVVTYPCGDMNGSGFIDITDAVTLVLYIFANGPAPLDEAGGDINCDGLTNISDAVYEVLYIFSGGSIPCAGCL